MNNSDLPPASPAPDPTSSSARARWLRRGIVTLAALGALYLGAVFALSRLLDPERLADRIQPRLAAVLNRDVEIGTATVRLLPFELRLENVEVADPTGLAPGLARVAAIGLRVQLMPLLRREVQVDRIIVVEPVLDLRVGSDGKSNFGDMSPEERDTPEGDGTPLALGLRGIRIEGGMVRYSNDVDTTGVEVAGLEARSDVSRSAGGPWSFDGDMSGAVTWTRPGGATTLAAAPFDGSFDMSTDQDFHTLTIGSGTLGMEAVVFAVTGEVTGLREPVRRVSLDLVFHDLPVERVFGMVPDSLKGDLVQDATGLLSAAFRIDGELGPDLLPTVTGAATLSGGRLVTDGSTLAQDLEGTVALLADRSLQPDVRGRVLGGPASVEGSLTFGAASMMDLTVQASPDLAEVEAFVPLTEGQSLAGRLDADTRVTGPLADPSRWRFQGDVRASDVRATHPELGVPIRIEQGHAVLTGTRADFQDLQVALGEDRLLASGQLRDLDALFEAGRTPYLEGRVEGRHLSLLNLSAAPPPDTSLTYGRVAFARVGGRSVKGRAPDEVAREMGLERPDSLPLAGRVEVHLDTLVDRRGVSEAVHAVVDFGPRYLWVSDATFSRYGGELSSSFNLALGTDADQPFALTLSARDVDASAFLGATTPLGSFVLGRITVELDVSGSLDALLLPTGRSLAGTGQYVVSGGGLQATPLTQQLASFLGIEALREPTIHNWGTSFVLSDGILRLADAVIDGAPGTPKVGGGVGLDGGLDLMAAFDFPATRLDAQALDRLGVAGNIAARLRERDDVVQAVLRIGGSVVNPAVRADPGSPARTLTNAVREETEREIQSQVDERKKALEDRATGFLRGVLQRRNAASAPPPDTVRADPPQADSVAVDTLRADSLRPDTLRPDTVRPDTVRPDTTRLDTPPAYTIRAPGRHRDVIRPER